MLIIMKKSNCYYADVKPSIIIALFAYIIATLYLGNRMIVVLIILIIIIVQNNYGYGATFLLRLYLKLVTSVYNRLTTNEHKSHDDVSDVVDWVAFGT